MGARRIALLVLFSAACSATLSPGSVGTLRYAGRVKGVQPLALLPPVSDPSGNIYVLNGSPTVPETHVFVGSSGGGWDASCSLTKGDAHGVHGWAGYATRKQWYWSGNALVAVPADGTACHAVLDRDPATNADLLFQAVTPAVRNLSEKTSLVAWVQSPTDALPFSGLVDLDHEILTNVQGFQPSDATDAAVVGVGGLRTSGRGIVLVQYHRGGGAFLELRGYDAAANETDRVTVNGGPFAAYAVQGYLAMDDGNLVAALVNGADGQPRLLTADSAGGDVIDVKGMTPVGVHRWDGQLWLVGVASRQPAVAQISRGGIGQVTAWSASSNASGAFNGPTPVRDDRSLPSRDTTWNDVKTGAGQFPFLGPHSLTENAPSTGLWVWAGPADTEGQIDMTAFAVSPVGVTYP